MGLREFFRTADRVTDHVMETYDEDGRTRTPELAEVERKLHKGFSSWSTEHSKRYPRMGKVPYRPDLFPDQRIDRPFRPINGLARAIAKGERSNNEAARYAKPAIYLGRLAYLNFMKKLHAKTVGSEALSATMVTGFLSTPADGLEFDSPSIAEYVVNSLEENMTIGLTSAHLEALADIGEFAGALNISIAELHGFKYIDRINTLINTNMTRQTYRVGRIPVPIPLLVTVGSGVFWGVPPGESAEKHGLDSKTVEEPNSQVSRAFVKSKKAKSMVFAYVPTGSGAVRTIDQETGEEKTVLKSAEYTAPLTVRCEGGIIPVNRFGGEIAIGGIVKNKRPEDVSKKDYEKILTDNLMQEHAIQATELTGLPTEYVMLYPEEHLSRSA